VTKKRHLLLGALLNKVVVRFRSRYDDGAIHGYVLDVGPRFLLLAFIDEYLRFNGYQCILLKNVKELEVPARYDAFIVAALRKRKQSIARRPNIKLNTLSELLESANRLFPLITIHREDVKPDSCWIGRIAEIGKSDLLLYEIGPDGVWDKKAKRHRLSEITRVDFGGGYEETLLLVGGDPRPKKRKRTHDG
jgi:hypothetical protein